MKLVSLITWIAAHWDLVMMILGEVVVALGALFGAFKTLAHAFIKIADMTATKVDNNVLMWISNASDAAGAMCDRILRKIPIPRPGPSALMRPISTRETRAVARQTLFGASPSIPPLGSGSPPGGVVAAQIVMVEPNPVPAGIEPVGTLPLDMPTEPADTTNTQPGIPKAPAP